MSGFNTFLAGLQGGQRMKATREALAAQQAQAQQAAQMQQQVMAQRQGAYDAYKSGNVQDAAALAGLSGDTDYAAIFQDLDDQQRADVKAKTDRIGQVASAILTLPAEQQGAAIQTYGKELGFSDEDIARAAANPAAELQILSSSVRDIEKMMAQANPEGVVVGSGSALVNPTTGAEMYSRPEAPDLPDGFMMGADGSPQVIPGYVDMKSQIAAAGRPSTTINTGDQGPQIGAIPKGYQAIQGQDGGYRMEPIPGGPEDQRTKAVGAMQTFDRATDTTIAALDRVIKMAGAQSAGVGSLTAVVPGTPGRDLAAELETVKANVAFNRLDEMRANSPTGGALGQVTERELDLLASVAGATDQGQSPQQLKANLERVRDGLIKARDERRRIFKAEYGGPDARAELLEKYGLE